MINFLFGILSKSFSITEKFLLKNENTSLFCNLFDTKLYEHVSTDIETDRPCLGLMAFLK